MGGVTAFQPSFTVTKRTTTGAATKPSILFSSKVTISAHSNTSPIPVRTWNTPTNTCGNFQRIRNVNYYHCSGSSGSSTTALFMGRRSSRRNKKHKNEEEEEYTPRVMQLPEDGGPTPEIAQVDPARYEELLQAKVDLMESMLHQAVSSSTSVLPPTEVFPSPKVGYRMRANFKLWRTGGKFDTKTQDEDDAAAEEEYEPTQVHYVMFAKGSRIPIKVTKYPMGSDLLQQLLDPIQQGLEATPILHTRINDIRFLTTLVGDILITITYNRPLLHDNHTNSDDTDNATASETAENNPWSRAVQTELIAPIVQAKTLLGPNNTITIVGRSKKVKLIVTGGKNQEMNTGNQETEEVQVGSDNNDDDDTNSTTSVDTASSASTSSSSSGVADEATVREILHVPMSVASHNNSNTVTTKEFRYTQTEGAFSQPNAIVCQSMLGWAYDVTRPPTSDSTTDDCTTATTTAAARNDYDLCELYCGNGCFTVVLASNFRYVVATEMNKASVQLAKDNLILNGITNVKVAKLNAEDFVLAYEHQKQFRRLTDAGIEIVLRYNHNNNKKDDDDDHGNADATEDTTTTTNSKTTTPKSNTIQFDRLHTLFVDPPRAGLDATCRSLAAKFERIVYISCNPETMVRCFLSCTRVCYFLFVSGTVLHRTQVNFILVLSLRFSGPGCPRIVTHPRHPPGGGFRSIPVHAPFRSRHCLATERKYATVRY